MKAEFGSVVWPWRHSSQRVPAVVCASGNCFNNKEKRMKGLFCLIGLIAGVCLTGFDFITSVIGFQSLIPQESVYFIAAPIVMAMLALAMNALAPAITRMLVEDNESKFSLMATAFTFFVCIVFDLLSSWIGFLVEFTQEENVGTALRTGGATRILAATITAIFVTIGPFLTGVFYDLLKRSGGVFEFMRGFFGGFGGR
jgi:hypothetical protein